MLKIRKRIVTVANQLPGVGFAAPMEHLKRANAAILLPVVAVQRPEQQHFVRVDAISSQLSDRVFGRIISGTKNAYSHRNDPRTMQLKREGKSTVMSGSIVGVVKLSRSVEFEGTLEF